MSEPSDVAKALKGLGVQLALEDDVATLTVDGVEVSRRWRWVEGGLSMSSALRQDGEADTLLLGERFPAALADLARVRGRWIADTAGNLHIRAPGVLLDVRGRRRTPEKSAGRVTAPRASSNLMSARRAQVVFCLLMWPQLVREPLRYVAEVSGVSASLAQLVLGALRDSGHLGQHASDLDGRAELVDQWAGAYGRGLARTLELGRFDGAPSLDAWRDTPETLRVSGEQAVDELRGAQTLTFYVPELEPRRVANARWRKATGAPDVLVRRKFWNEPEPARLAATGFPLAPPLMVYADLVNSDDPRLREIARSLKGDLGGPADR